MSTTKPNYKLFALVLWAIYLTGLLFVFSIFYRISTGNLGYMPTFEELENPQSDLASEVFTADEQLLGKFYRENRSPVRFDDLSPHLVNALQATEDVRFLEHAGIDPRGLGRVLFKTLLMGKNTGGGSTISQQLAKNLYPRDTTHYHSKVSKAWAVGKAKFKEWVTAVKLERNYTKKEIMAMYLNTVSYGQSSFGIKAAAKTYFNTTPDSLKLEEAAVLVGLLKGPSLYNPVTSRPEKKVRALERRNTVLAQMNKYKEILKHDNNYDFVTEIDYDSITQQPIKLNLNKASHLSGLAPYFREYLRQAMTVKEPIKENYRNSQSWLEDSTEWADNPLYGWCNKNKKPDQEFYNIYQDGLRIYTTIDSRMQQYAEEATSEHMTELQEIFMKQKGKENGWGKRGPFSSKLNTENIERILHLSMVRSERYRVMYAAGFSRDEIAKSFEEPTEMRVFTWTGDRDTIMTPMDSIRHYKYYLNAGLISVEPQSGHVKAYIGGIDYHHFKYDHATQAKRQVGSTFKPFIYTLAMQGGYSPCHQIPNIEYTFIMPPGQQPATYTPTYSTNQYIRDRDGEMITLKYGLAHSLNQVSAWVLKQYTPEAAIKIAQAMGVRSHLDPVPSLCTGAAEVRLIEMVGAYTSFANKGVHTQPIFVTRIEDKHGNILVNFKAKQNIAISEETAFKMIGLMRGVVDFGTSKRLRYKYKLENQIAGKTGTTNDNSDGWFMGMIPELVTGVWVGGEERSIRFSNTLYGQGASMALPIWAKYMTKVYANKNLPYDQKATFSSPPGFNPNSIDCNTFKEERSKLLNSNYSVTDEVY